MSSAVRSTLLVGAAFLAAAVYAQLPKATPDGYALPNGWKITPPGRFVNTEDMVLKLVTSPDDRVVIASHSGYNPHGLVVADPKTDEGFHSIRLKTPWRGMAWSPDAKTLYVSGGNANGQKRIGATLAPIYEMAYAD